MGDRKHTNIKNIKNTEEDELYIKSGKLEYTPDNKLEEDNELDDNYETLVPLKDYVVV